MNQPSSDGIKIGLDIVTPSSRFSEEFVEKFSDQGLGTSTSPRQMFSYIAGQENLEVYDRLNEKLLDLVKEAGYEGALGVEEYHLAPGDDPFSIPPTVHVYPFPLRPIDSLRARFQPIRRIIPYLPRLRIPLMALRNWSALATALLERAAETGGLWHLWGHSWEIEKYSMWDELETVLAAAAKYTQARPVTNSQLARIVADKA